jgi:multiple sugar transport system permease protein/raffinose/stachyose/melibiose transport system permease protein
MTISDTAINRGVAHHRRRWRVQWKLHLTLLVLLVLTFYPVVLLLLFSVKNNTQFYTERFTLSFPFYWGNFMAAWASGIAVYMGNSALYALVAVVLTLVAASLSAYAFARMRFIGKELLFYLILGLLMIPGVLTLVPSFVLLLEFNLLNTRWALWLPYAAGGQAFAIFVLRTFFAGLPEELFESARIDGASEFTVLRRITLPLSKPILGTLALLQIYGIWNDLVWPLTVITKPELKTVMVGLLGFTSQFNTDYGPLYAGYVIASLPLIVLFALTSGLFIQGLTSGAIKI